MSVFLLTSQRNAMRALASQGIFATDCHAQVCSIIAQHLSPAHAALIAEPQHDPGHQRRQSRHFDQRKRFIKQQNAE